MLYPNELYNTARQHLRERDPPDPARPQALSLSAKAVNRRVLRTLYYATVDLRRMRPMRCSAAYSQALSFRSSPQNGHASIHCHEARHTLPCLRLIHGRVRRGTRDARFSGVGRVPALQCAPNGRVASPSALPLRPADPASCPYLAEPSRRSSNLFVC